MTWLRTKIQISLFLKEEQLLKDLLRLKLGITFSNPKKNIQTTMMRQPNFKSMLKSNTIMKTTIKIFLMILGMTLLNLINKLKLRVCLSMSMKMTLKTFQMTLFMIQSNSIERETNHSHPHRESSLNKKRTNTYKSNLMKFKIFLNFKCKKLYKLTVLLMHKRDKLINRKRLQGNLMKITIELYSKLIKL